MVNELVNTAKETQLKNKPITAKTRMEYKFTNFTVYWSRVIVYGLWWYMLRAMALVM